jgi:hypothetical protein
MAKVEGGGVADVVNVKTGYSDLNGSSVTSPPGGTWSHYINEILGRMEMTRSACQKRRYVRRTTDEKAATRKIIG